MRIVSVGGGPAGLFFAILVKRLDPRHEVTVIERNGPDDAFGWGVVFSDETLGHFAQADEESHRAMTERMAFWTDIDVFVHGERIRSTGHGFCGISRKVLLNLLQRRAEELGARLLYRTEVARLDELPPADLIVGADGVNSRLRQHLASHLQPTVEWGRCRFSWLGTTLPLDAFTFIFKPSDHGLFKVHAYPFAPGLSTFIVECHEDVWKRAGLDEADEAASVAYLESLFAAELDGHRLLTNKSVWRAFPTVRNERWTHGNVVLLGDAAHTAHFSIGSGTKLAMEDALALSETLRRLGPGDVERVLEAYEGARAPVVARFQAAARTSQEWFEEVGRHHRREALTFTFDLLTRSRRVTYEALRKGDPELVQRASVQFAASNPHRDVAVPPPPGVGTSASASATDRSSPGPPVLQPYRLRAMTLANRIVVSSMCQYSSRDGFADDWHLVHLGSRAVGGAALVMTEATHVGPEARITAGCAGMYRPEHVTAWRRVVDFVHRCSRARIGLQLSHAGRKGSCTVPWEGGRPLLHGGWDLLAPSPIPYDSGWPVPRAMDRSDMDRVRDQFRRAAVMAEDAGFDILELHMAHGYLLGTFISPLTNRREDAYGGPIEGRMRFPIEVLDAVRAAWPSSKPISVRISATDWKPGGLDGPDRVAAARLLAEHGCDVVDVSGGQTVSDQRPLYGRMFLSGFSDEIRHEAGVPTMTVGNIENADQANTLLAAGRADLCVLARAHLVDPYLTLHAAATEGWDQDYWPVQYLPARPRRRV